MTLTALPLALSLLTFFREVKPSLKIAGIVSVGEWFIRSGTLSQKLPPLFSLLFFLVSNPL